MLCIIYRKVTFLLRAKSQGEPANEKERKESTLRTSLVTKNFLTVSGGKPVKTLDYTVKNFKKRRCFSMAQPTFEF